MTDRELLEFAAKAEGRYVWRGQGHQADMLFTSPSKPDTSGKVTGVEWNPLTDDGDALRLAVKLELDLKRYAHHAVETTGRGPTHGTPGTYLNCRQNLEDDPYAATRRAITRAAAEIGKGIVHPMPAGGLPEDNYYKSMAEAEELGRAEIGKAMP